MSVFVSLSMCFLLVLKVLTFPVLSVTLPEWNANLLGEFGCSKPGKHQGVNRLFWLEKNQNPSVADGFSAISHQKLNQPSGIHPPPRK